MRSVASALIRGAARRCNSRIDVGRSAAVRQYSPTISLSNTPPPHVSAAHHDVVLYRRSNKTAIDSSSSSSRPQNEQEAHQLFLDFLNGAPARPPLPSSVTKVDAYLHLRQFQPRILSSIDDESLDLLCMQVGIERIGGVINNLLDDLDGIVASDEDSLEDPNSIIELSMKLKEIDSNTGGIFAAAAGSKRRMTAIQNLVIGASRRRTSTSEDELFPDKDIDDLSSKDHIMSDSTLSRALNMLQLDFRLLQQEQGYNITTTSPIPIDLDVGTARRLSRSIFRTKDGSLAPILSELIRHLSRSDMIEGAFPMALEGCHLINYYLRLDPETSMGNVSVRPSSSTSTLPETMQAANYILDQMAKSDPEAVTDFVINEASRVGQEYKSYLCDHGVSESEASHLSLRHTLHSIVFQIMLKRRRFTWVEKQLSRMLEELKSTAKQHEIETPIWLLFHPVQVSIQQAATALHGRKKAFDLAARFIDVWTQAEGRGGNGSGGNILKMICERAITDEDPRLVIRMLQVMTDRRGNTTTRQLAPEAITIGAPILMRMFNFQANHRRGDMVSQMLLSLGLIDLDGIIIDGQIDSLFPEPLRAEFIAMIAKAGLKAQSRALYERWGSAMDSAITLEQVYNHIKDVRDQEISIKKPSSSERSLASSNTLEAPVQQSHKCLSALIKLYTTGKDKPYLPSYTSIDGEELLANTVKKETTTIHEDIQFCYHVLFQFIQSKDRALMDRGDFVALSSAYFSLGQRMAAFKCLSDVVKREDKPTIEEAATLLKLLTTVNLVRTAELLLSRISYWIKRNSQAEWTHGDQRLSQLYVPLLSTCLRVGQVDLAKRLLASAKENGIEQEVSIRGISGLTKFLFRSSPLQSLLDNVDAKLVEGINIKREDNGSDTLFMARWVKNLMEKERWRPDPNLLSWMIQKSVRVPGLLNADDEEQGENSSNHNRSSSSYVPFSLKDNRRKAAIVLMSLSARYLGYLDMQVARVVLATIQNKAFHWKPKSKGATLISVGLSNEVDEVASNLRWTPYIFYNDGFTLEDKIEPIPAPPIGQATLKPNRLPPILYCRLINTYLRVGDVHGAASVMAWARDEAQLTFAQIEAAWDNRKYSFKDFLKKVALSLKKSKVGVESADIMELLAGAVPVPKSKLWWQRPVY